MVLLCSTQPEQVFATDLSDTWLFLSQQFHMQHPLLDVLFHGDSCWLGLAYELPKLILCRNHPNATYTQAFPWVDVNIQRWFSLLELL